MLVLCMGFSWRYLSICFQDFDLSADRLENDIESSWTELPLKLLIMDLEYVEILLVERCIVTEADYVALANRTCSHGKKNAYSGPASR